MENSHKGKTGLRRLINATRYSLSGVAAALRHEDAFRQEAILAAILVPTGVMLSLLDVAVVWALVLAG